jgi:hypothetical protein
VIRRLITLLLFLITPQIVWGEVASAGIFSQYRLTAGVVSYTGDFVVFENEESPAAGTLTADFEMMPYVLLVSPYRYFGEKDFAVAMEYDFTGFVEGYSAFVTPTVVVSLFGREPYGKHNQSLIAGVGFGIGYLEASGDIILTETTLQRKRIDISGPALALSVFGDYRVEDYVFRVHLGMTSTIRGGDEYRFTKYSFDVGYVFDL